MKRLMTDIVAVAILCTAAPVIYSVWSNGFVLGGIVGATYVVGSLVEKFAHAKD